MKIILLITSFFFFGLQAQAATKRCGTTDISHSARLLVDLQTGVFFAQSNPQPEPIQPVPVVIPVYIHATVPVEEAVLEEQMKVIQDAYLGTGLHFELKTINILEADNPWKRVAPQSIEEMNMKMSLRQGGRDALNVYVVRPTGGVLGWATFPWDVGDNMEMDGVVVDVQSLPGGVEPYGLGRTLTHEVGHWLGLLHTFQGGCSGDGDFVADTPAQAAPTFGCPKTPVSSCNAGEFDPINNFMNYSDDVCLTEFSPMQVERALLAIETFRTVSAIPPMSLLQE